MNEIRVVIVGKTGVGKSAVGNSLLKKKLFESKSSAGSVTSKCKYGSRKLEDGTNLVIVDTPGIFDKAKLNMDTSKELVRCIGLSSPGPHVFFFVLKIGAPFTAEEMDIIQNLKEIFGKEVMRYVIVVFTCKDKLGKEQTTLDEYVRKAPAALKKLITECDRRFVAIDNQVNKDKREGDIQKIFQVIRKTMTENVGKHYTGEMYEAAEEALNERFQLLEEKHKKEPELDQKAKDLEEESLKKKKLEEEMASLKELQQYSLQSKKREEELARLIERLNNLCLEEEKEQSRLEEKMKQLVAEKEEEQRKIKEERKQESKEQEEERESRLEKEGMEREEIKEREEREAERKRLEEEREKLEENNRERLREEVQDDDSFSAVAWKSVATVVKKRWDSFVNWLE